MWLVSAIKKNLVVTMAGCIKEEVPLVWASGMVGAMAAFETKKDALNYAQGDFSLLREIKFTGEEIGDE